MILAAYTPDWTREFEALQCALTRALPATVLRIEHVGSTAIPEIRAKPILDIDVVIPSHDAFSATAAALAHLGYVHNGNQGIVGRDVFKRTDDAVPWCAEKRTWMRHHLYVCPADSKELQRHLRFRDILRNRPDLRAEYEARKIGIESRSAHDPKVYARIKEEECREFVERVLQEPSPRLSSQPSHAAGSTRVPPKPTSVQIERSFSAPPDAVWRAWTDAKMVSRWFGSDPAGKVLAARLEVRIQGQFEVTFADSNGSEHTCSGTYLEVLPTAKLSFSWHWRSEPGIETFVQVGLDPEGAGTRMRFEHSGLNATSTHDYAAGWQRTFEKLARVLEATH